MTGLRTQPACLKDLPNELLYVIICTLVMKDQLAFAVVQDTALWFQTPSVPTLAELQVSVWLKESLPKAWRSYSVGLGSASATGLLRAGSQKVRVR